MAAEPVQRYQADLSVPGFNLITAEADDAIRHIETINSVDPAKAFFVYLAPGATHARALDSALRTSPNDADLLALALNGALRAGDAAEARAFADRLAALRPDDPDLARLRRSLQGR